MVRTVKGVTLTPEERAKAGYDATSASASAAPAEHTCTITLPNGAPCTVSYRRYSARSHQFSFGEPLKDRHFLSEALSGGIPAIEAKVAQLGTEMFQKAQEKEQQEMRQKKSAGRRPGSKDTGPQIEARLAERLAGLYAPCVRHTSGNLLRIGGTYSTPEGALKELQSGKHRAARLANGQRLVVGICNRSAQRWEEPAFLASPPSETPPPVPTSREVQPDPNEEEAEEFWDGEPNDGADPEEDLEGEDGDD